MVNMKDLNLKEGSYYQCSYCDPRACLFKKTKTGRLMITKEHKWETQFMCLGVTKEHVKKLTKAEILAMEI